MTTTTKRLPETKLTALKLIPGAALLIQHLADTPGVYLVGGAVRDLMLGFAQFDFDLVVEGDAAEIAHHLAERIGGSVAEHERFGTATFRANDGLVVDIATARTETYAQPGALPVTAPASLADDLVRRDFTVNAMAVALWEEKLGEITEYPGASADLSARVLRVTHDNSFIDDPSRLLRLLRYGSRLGFTAEPHTEELARRAVAAGAPGTISGRRIADELLDLLAERSALVALDSMRALELDHALDPLFEADEYVASRSLLDLPDGIRQDLLLMSVCCMRMPSEELDAWLDRLNLEAGERAVVSEAVLRHDEVFVGLDAEAEESALDARLRRCKAETATLAAAVPGVDRELAARTRKWLRERRDDHLRISGTDLLAAGIPEGPAIGRALAATLALTVDGEVEGREQQLQRAVEIARAIAHPQ
ncbi:MAG: CCA tRNA nucleotidyltransferase [Actinobacteria bacterium]|nr:CCA tRNA nucleotidyltransferase [Actinomycetota bacterium]